MKDFRFAFIGTVLILVVFGIIAWWTTDPNPPGAAAGREKFFSSNPETQRVVTDLDMERARESNNQEVVFSLHAKKVVAHEIQLVSADGKVRMHLEAESNGFGDGPRITIFDPQGNLAFELRSYIHANVLEVHSPMSEDHVEIGATESGGSIVLWKNDLEAGWKTPPQRSFEEMKASQSR